MSKEETSDVEVLEFDLKIQQFPVKLTNEKGVVEQFVLRELSGAERDTYLGGIGKRMRIGKDGKSQGLRDYKDLQASLLVLGLYHADGRPVSIKLVQSWPARVQQALHDKLKKMSGLEDGAEDDAKND